MMGSASDGIRVMEIYLAGLLESAGRTQIGQMWTLDRAVVMVHLGTTDQGFDLLQQQLETRMPGRWDRASSPDRNSYVYVRLA
jgi:hypothetical protein